jgi:hypothetical protein
MILATLDVSGTQSCEAFGHPSDCTEPAPGSVSQYQSKINSIRIITNNNSSRAATTSDANLNFSSHSHDYSVEQGCHEDSSHKLIPNVTSSTVTIDGSPIFVKEYSVQTDPVSNGSVDIKSEEVNKTIVET